MIRENWELQMNKNKPPLSYPLQRWTQSKWAVHVMVGTETVTLLEGDIKNTFVALGETEITGKVLTTEGKDGRIRLGQN